MKDLSKLGPKGLATELERREQRCSKAVDAVFVLAEHRFERLSDICARLGDAHPAVKALHAASEAKMEAHVECRRRYGQAVMFNSMWVTFLRVRG